MKRVLIRFAILLMALSCAFTLFSCREEEESSFSNLIKEATVETTELPTEVETTCPVSETVPVVTEAETVATTEATTEPPLEETSTIPGSEQLPATVLLGYTFGQLRELEWTRSSTIEGEMWVLQAKSCWTDFTFIFRGEYLDHTAKPAFLTIEDPDGDGYAYVAYGIKINDTASVFPTAVQEKIAPADNGFYAMAVLDGVSTTLMFRRTRDMQPGKLYNVQFQQEI